MEVKNGNFFKILDLMCKQAIQILNNCADGKANPGDVVKALKTLANGDRLYVKRGETLSKLGSYYWVNGSKLQNASSRTSYTIRSVSSDRIETVEGQVFTKVYAQDCERIKF